MKRKIKKKLNFWRWVEYQIEIREKPIKLTEVFMMHMPTNENGTHVMISERQAIWIYRRRRLLQKILYKLTGIIIYPYI